MSIRQLSFFAIVMLASVAGALAQSPPVNDDFANRTVLSGSSITFAGTLAGATLEPAESSNQYDSLAPSVGGSVWWTWTATQSTTVVITLMRDYSVIRIPWGSLDVYSGSALNTLTRLDSTSMDAPAGRYVTFAATAGTSYQIRAVGSAQVSFSLMLIATNPPVFLAQPKDCTVSPYGSAVFSAMAVGPKHYPWDPSSTTYQWTSNGVPIPNQIYPSLIINNVTTNQSGSYYSVIASNAGGLTVSAAAMLTVTQTNPVPRLAGLDLSDPAMLSFTLKGEGGRWYKIESSEDLKNWVNPIWVQSTNETSLFSVPRLGPTHFVRASLDVPTDVCVAQLKQMRAALNVFAIESRSEAFDTFTLSDIRPYAIINPRTGSLLACPEGATYSPPATIEGNISCTLQARGHVIPDP